MEMRFFWATDQVEQGNFMVKWTPGKENLADYFTKHFDSKHHQEVRAWYLHVDNISPRLLPRAAAPSALRGCVGKLPGAYSRMRCVVILGDSLEVTDRDLTGI